MFKVVIVLNLVIGMLSLVGMYKTENRIEVKMKQIMKILMPILDGNEMSQGKKEEVI